MVRYVERQIKLKDNRTLAYTEYGTSSSRTVLHFHGSPSSRLEGNIADVDSIARRLHLRLIFPDRPGFGRSDFKNTRTLLDWADDVVELADQLDLNEFAVVGLSGGVPHAIACAYRIPHRLSAVGLLGGISPPYAPNAFEGVSRSNQMQITIARRMPWLLRLLFWQTRKALWRNPDSVIDELISELSKPDQSVLSSSAVRERFTKAIVEAFRHGSRGVAYDQILITRPWGFQLGDIAANVYLWHGERDTLCSVNMGRYLADAIPNCSANILKNEGHISLYIAHYEVIVRTLVRCNE